MTSLPDPEQWKKDLARSFRRRGDLLKFLKIEETRISPEPGDFPTLVTESFAQKMTPGDPRDPLLLQVLRSSAEYENKEGNQDAVGDLDSRIAPSLIRKYQSRTLMVSTAACAIHCRYCFRRHFPYDTLPKTADKLAGELSEIKNDALCREIIFSGGDPLMLEDRVLQRLLETANLIEQVETLRFHSRIPVVLPSRIHNQFAELFQNIQKNKVMVIHVNHPAELGKDTRNSLQALKEMGFILLNQSVLLKGINDSADVLNRLHKELLSQGVVPYYLHQMDEVQGAIHFKVSVERGRELINALWENNSGYMVPRYVAEIKGEAGKTPL